MDQFEMFLSEQPSLVEVVADMPTIPIPCFRPEVHPVRHSLETFARGTSRQAEIIAKHLEVCPSCRQKVEQMKNG